ncbi:MAG TPA: hypothetical protein VKT77_02875, partial [Chthonomonadaceae bacterium]|nr:hypothetical protein [Chthonomonadaceae bacterium]
MQSMQAGAAVRDITPPESLLRADRVWLWGFGSRTQPCGGVHDPLSVRALALTDAGHGIAVLVSLDVCALEPQSTGRVRSEAARSYGLSAAGICLNVTHTHGAPAMVSIPTWTAGFALADQDYVRLVEQRTVETIGAALAALAPAKLRLARGRSSIAIDRHFGEPGVHDRTLDVLRAVGTGGETIATAIFTACHPVCRGDYNRVSADFAGVAREQVEHRLGGIALFVQGFTGISNPRVRDAETIGEALAAETVALCAGSITEVAGPLRCVLGSVNLPLEPLTAPDVLARAAAAGGVHARWARAMAAQGDAAPGALRTPIQAIAIGDGSDAWLLSASGHEV